MRKSILTLIAGMSLMAVGPTVSAAGIGVVGGTLGAGAFVGFKPSENTVLRLQGTKWNLKGTKTYNNIDYDVNIDVGAVGAYLDIYPFSGVFHVSLGFNKSLNEIKVSNARTVVNQQIGNNFYNRTIPAGQLGGKASFDTAPYVGLGWGGTLSEGFGFRLDIGAHFLGKPTVSLYDKTGTITQADLRAEENKIRNSIGNVIYPEVSLALTYGW